MKLKLDENLPRRLVNVLAALGHDVETVPEERLGGRDDGVVWKAAQEAGRFLITQIWTSPPPGDTPLGRITACSSFD